MDNLLFSCQQIIYIIFFSSIHFILRYCYTLFLKNLKPLINPLKSFLNPSHLFTRTVLIFYFYFNKNSIMVFYIIKIKNQIKSEQNKEIFGWGRAWEWSRRGKHGWVALTAADSCDRLLFCLYIIIYIYIYIYIYILILILIL